MELDFDIFVILKEDANDYKRKSIYKLASMVQQFFDDQIMEHTREAMADKPLPGEFEGNCHNIALAFMTDLIIARRAQGWFWARGINSKIGQNGKVIEHSWLEYNNFVVDLTKKQKEKPDQQTIIVDEAGSYYKAHGTIIKTIKRRNAARTRKWISINVNRLTSI